MKKTQKFAGDSLSASQPAGRFPVVAIGASAGGLQALEELFDHMPADTNMAFVVVTHQHPGHTTLLPELLAKHTSLPVLEAKDGVKLQPNHVYIAPSGGQLNILNGRLHRTERSSSTPPHLPIDHFFRSLAEDQNERAICIILSGTGTDGTLGLKAIKGESGMAMVQQVQSAKYAGMPSSAIATGLADYVLPPENMGGQLVSYAQGPYLAAPPAKTDENTSDEPMQKIFLLLRTRTGHDFSNYKASTIRRRIERRMNVHQIKDAPHYVRFLQENPHEVDILFKELLISVTCFFRDTEAFKSVATDVLPTLLESRPDHYTLRAWVPGCATGEEVYSLAILMREAIEASKRPFEAQLFGTDLDSAAIESARNGHYPDGIAVDIDPKHLERYFLREDSGYRIRKDIREMVIFAVQNVIKDPPFTKLDFISCRNLLIYLNSDIQKKLLPIFHYALKPGGILFLGPSESISGYSDLFEQVDKKWKIFRRKETPLPTHTMLHFPLESTRPADELRPLPASRQVREPGINALVDRLLLSRFAPASVVVNDRGDLIFIHGRIGRYLEPAPGHPRLNIHDMAREGLQFELASALRQASIQPAGIHRENVRVRTNGDFSGVDFSVIRLEEPDALRGLFLVAFRDHPAPIQEPDESTGSTKKDGSTRVAQLEHELQHIKESLQTTIEELETSNEELKSTNEELQSTNEELQSTNEELETSKEEMQSLNEELTTVNSELQSKVEELSRANDDLQNLLNSTEIATIFLDRKLQIKRYTDQAKRLVNLIQTDIGRPLADLATSLDYDSLVSDCREVLRTLVFKQAEVQCRDQQWFLMRIMPYRTAENVIDGLVLTFVNINPVKKVEEELNRAQDRLVFDLEAMKRLQTIGTLFVRNVNQEEILSHVLDTAIFITCADMGSIQVIDPASNQLKLVHHRGFDHEPIPGWPDQDVVDVSGSPQRCIERVIVEDVSKNNLLDDTQKQTMLLKSGVGSMLVSPLLNRNNRLIGMISTHFNAPHSPDDRTLHLLDLLARQTAEILERTASNQE